MVANPVALVEDRKSPIAGRGGRKERRCGKRGARKRPSGDSGQPGRQKSASRNRRTSVFGVKIESALLEIRPTPVIPAKAGIHNAAWIPAIAGMTIQMKQMKGATL